MHWQCYTSEVKMYLNPNKWLLLKKKNLNT